MIDNRKHKARAILVGVLLKDDSMGERHKDLEELRRLLDTLGVEAHATMIQSRETIDSRTFIGSGKVEEIRNRLGPEEISVVVFDDELSPSQMRSLEQDLKIEVLDRTGVILRIFSQNARTYESKLQIELAGLEYALPRLKRQWTHLSRQRGGRGFLSGEGETQLEADRRAIRTSIQQTKAKLEKIQSQRDSQKKNRRHFFKVAIAGYTNSGKSTLLNALTQSEVLVEDKLFATLDPSTRIIKPDEKPAILFSDTVGFIKKLPHALVASFRSTFEEIRDADLILHVVDCSDPDYTHRIHDTVKVLKELDLDSIPRLMVFNKIDRMKRQPIKLKMIKSVHSQAAFVSAIKSEGLEDLKNKIYASFKRHMREMQIEVSFGCESILEKIYEWARVLQTEYTEDSISIHFRGARRDLEPVLDQLRRNGYLLTEKSLQVSL